jgi:molecular chaperone GrpE
LRVGGHEIIPEAGFKIENNFQRFGLKTKKEHMAKHSQVASAVADGSEKGGSLSEIDTLKVKLEEKEKEAVANYDKFVRAVAELDNYKKRAAKEKAQTIKYGSEELIKDILPFLDSLDRVMENTGGAEVESFKEGIKLVQEQLLCCLKKHGVERIESSGADFDPNYHEAIMQIDSEEHEENKIVNEVTKGYLLNGRLLRPSRVCVCKKNKEDNVCEKTAEDGE